jgi:hypothetical protein
MLIQKPAAEVFAAFINPAVTTKFGSPKAAAGLKTASLSFGRAVLTG